jgi:Per1-like family
MPQPHDARELRLQADCRYRCMQAMEEARRAEGLKRVKYHGKWAFTRIYGAPCHSQSRRHPRGAGDILTCAACGVPLCQHCRRAIAGLGTFARYTDCHHSASACAPARPSCAAACRHARDCVSGNVAAEPGRAPARHLALPRCPATSAGAACGRSVTTRWHARWYRACLVVT